MLAFANILAHGRSYENGFTKKCDSHKLCVKLHEELRFDRFFVHRLGISKYWSFPTYLPMGNRMSLVSIKNVTIINFEQCHAQNRVSIGFSCIVSKF
ncbi:hypothetical protein BHE74_00058753 [Ensete ventricosum]|nr:hypothetical protein GW17_00058745 [Ensete ventricosum]RWW36234.1 hypothetical protein BHE74_00058753 [Ensete ventricosum]